MADSLDRTALIASLADCIAAVARGDDERARDIIGEIAHAYRANGSQPTLPGIQGPPPAMTADMARKSAVGRLFAFWQDRCDHKQAKLTPDRTRAILARLKEGYSEAEIRKAIEGASVAAYVNDDGQKYDDLTLICRNGSKLESFIERGVRSCGVIVVELGDGSTVEEQIADLRVKMADMRRQGRQSEYEQSEADLKKLMAKRSAQ